MSKKQNYFNREINKINSVKTEYDENPLLSINQITLVPNNTPENSPSHLIASSSSSSTTTRSLIHINENSNNNFTAHEGGKFIVRSILKDDGKNNNNNNNNTVGGGGGRGGGGGGGDGADNTKEVEEEQEEEEQDISNEEVKDKNTIKNISIKENKNSRTIHDHNMTTTNMTSSSNNNSNNNNPNDILRQNNNNNNNNSSPTSDDNSSNNNNNSSSANSLQQNNKRRNTVIASDLHFDSTKTRTDPNVKTEQSTLKMSSWIHSKYDDNEYSLNENDKSNKKNNIISSNPPSSTEITSSSSSNIVPSSSDSQYPSNILKIKNNSSSDILLPGKSNSNNNNNTNNNTGLTSPKLPKLPSFGKLEEERSRLNSSRSNDLSRYHEQFVTSSLDPSRIPTGKQQLPQNYVLNNGQPINKTDLPSSAPTETISPTSQPKIINSKFDGLRTRLLNNPKKLKQRRHSDEEDVMGNAAAVLSNMRSSPFKLGERTLPPLNSLTTATTTTNDTGLLRPHSSSFSSRGSNLHTTRPRVVINKIEIDPKGTEHAISQSSTDDEGEIDNNKKFSNNQMNDLNGQEVVNWNKNGKRVSTTHIDTDKIKIIKNDSKYVPIASAKPSSPSSPSSSQQNQSNKDTTGLKLKKANSKKRMEPLSPEVLRANISGARNSFRVISNGQNGKVGQTGTRSRTGCWICRLRKKKCTEEKPSCINCSRLNLTCYYDEKRPDFVSDPVKKAEKLLEIKKYTREAKKNAMRKRTYIQSPTESETSSSTLQ
ncbi:similar to Saccharomyces cerevisiae YDR207C UME6 Key transcriptional regulator of early meiotic genes [Maudiozyma saulgeensis]|uniref:Similar to Saccharomyces cerevisiae YDR207C UME6 Key transcriptional regulator of early meiotic genes n=1 Tax=Maudiozyma saulgeensis TaxID=1789683 RepID=A0A1X7R5E7_9SACH|nr:similar to Saccharomyces cerevisiae YDR207C UME6 Key transcriptional regulator of early meiotic genes [Kazachstania saulgeensis]